MNPFHTYPGFKMNGKFYSREALQKAKTSEALTDNQNYALHFARSLFHSHHSIEVMTSGSTGPRKAFYFDKNAVHQSAQATNSFFGLDTNSRALLALPMDYIAGKMMVARAIAGGYDLTVEKPSSQPLPSGFKADFTPLTPYQIETILKSAPERFTNIKTYLIGGGAPSKRVLNNINKSGVEAFSSFGMTETLSHFALAKLDKESLRYKPLPGVSIKTGSDNKLQIKWPGITRGWLNTNDLARIEEGCFEWLGRADNLINSGGIKIIPEEVEKLLADKIEAPFFVHGCPHPKLGQQVILFIEGKTGIDLDNINWKNLYQKPKEVVVISSFERTLSGKIQRQRTALNSNICNQSGW